MNKRIRKKRGYDHIKDSDLWDLDYTLTKYILPRLIKFKEINTNSYPIGFKGVEDWHNVIDKMIWSFQKMYDDNWNIESKDKTEEEMKRYEEGMNLFAKHYMDLWD